MRQGANRTRFSADGTERRLWAHQLASGSRASASDGSVDDQSDGVIMARPIGPKSSGHAAVDGVVMRGDMARCWLRGGPIVVRPIADGALTR
jgi:hypothetical protein